MGKFQGKILLQARTIQSVGKAFLGTDCPNSRTQREILAFLGNIILAGKNGLLLDGSISDADQQRADAAIDELDLRKGVQWNLLSVDRVAHSAHQAVEVLAGSGVWDSYPETLDWRLPEEKPEEVRQWLNDVEPIISSLLEVVGKPEDAHALGMHLSSNGCNWLRGNKLFGGIALHEAQLFAEDSPNSSRVIPKFSAAFQAASEMQRYRLLTSLITEFRTPLLMGFAGEAGAVSSYSGEASAVTAYKRRLWLELLGHLSVHAEARGEVFEAETDALYSRSLAAVGVLALHAANPQQGRSGLLQVAHDFAEAPDFSALLRFLVERDLGASQLSLTSENVSNQISEMEAKLRKDRILKQAGGATKHKVGMELLPDTVSAAAKAAVSEFTKSCAQGVIPAVVAAHLSATFAPAASALTVAALAAAVGAGAVALPKVVRAAFGPKGDYAGGIAALQDAYLSSYDQAAISAAFERIWQARSL